MPDCQGNVMEFDAGLPRAAVMGAFTPLSTNQRDTYRRFDFLI